MVRQHIACQWNGQVARLILNKCSGRVAQRPYVRLRPLAYVTCSRLHGGIGSPPGRGAEAYTIRSGHVLAPNPRLALIKAWVFSVPESRDPACEQPGPHTEGSRSHPRGPVCARGGPGPHPEAWSVYTGVRHFRMGVRTYC
jgi:hypothetical protein